MYVYYLSSIYLLALFLVRNTTICFDFPSISIQIWCGSNFFIRLMLKCTWICHTTCNFEAIQTTLLVLFSPIRNGKEVLSFYCFYLCPNIIALQWLNYLENAMDLTLEIISCLWCKRTPFKLIYMLLEDGISCCKMLFQTIFDTIINYCHRCAPIPKEIPPYSFVF